MQTPARDVLRLLAGRLTVDEAKQRDWLNRGRKPLEDRLAKFRGQRSSLEDIFATTDTTPDAVRAAAYRVEARRSLLRALDNFLVLLLLIAGVGAGAVAYVLGLWWGVGVAGAALGTIVSVGRLGVGRAIEAVPWGQGLEPLAWALYYPAQVAQDVLDANEELRAAPNKSLLCTWQEMLAEIERGPDGEALPGQETKIEEAVAFQMVKFPQLVESMDSSRDLAHRRTLALTFFSVRVVS